MSTFNFIRLRGSYRAILRAVSSLCLLAAVSGMGWSQAVPRYSCLHKAFDTQRWLAQFKRTLDGHGVLMQDNEYHPLSIAFFGIMNYDDFVSTGDTCCRRQVCDQYKYFANPSKLTSIHLGLGIGYPYTSPYIDLNAPWFSGMTQGVAISFLLRYYLLQKDPLALWKARQAAHFMLRPIANGGALGRTPEGNLWIEEYPNSQHSPQVLNGFINGLIGLYEYCQFFPEDAHAREVHDTCLASLLATIPAYNTPDWTHYDRSKQHPVSNQYMRYEISQMEHLYEIYHDERFLHQMMLWSMQLMGKSDYGIRFYREQEYQYCGRLQLDQNGPGYSTQLELQFASLPCKGLQTLIGGRRIDLKLPVAIAPGERLGVSLPEARFHAYLTLGTYSDPNQAMAFAWDGFGRQVPLTVQPRPGALEVYSTKRFRYLVVMPSSESASPLELLGVAAYSKDQQRLPMFLSHVTKPEFKLEAGRQYQLRFPSKNITGLKVFYRHAPETDVHKVANWRTDQMIRSGSRVFTAPADGYYQFLFCFPFLIPSPMIGEVEVSAVPE